MKFRKKKKKTTKKNQILLFHLVRFGVVWTKQIVYTASFISTVVSGTSLYSLGTAYPHESHLLCITITDYVYGDTDNTSLGQSVMCKTQQKYVV